MTAPTPVHDQQQAHLLLRRDEFPNFSAFRECDSRTALTRGLAQYLSQVASVFGGRAARPVKVFDTYPGPDQIQVLPAIAVVSDQPLEYDTTNLTPSSLYATNLPRAQSINPPQYVDQWLIQTSAVTTNLKAEIWCADPTERMALAMAIEDAMVPVAWMYGFRLALPFYFSAVAEYAGTSIEYLDDDQTIWQRYRRLAVRFDAEVPVYKHVQGPRAKILAKFFTDGAGPEATTFR